MPENPLLPNAQLRALHALLTGTLLQEKALRGRGRPRKTSVPSPLRHREALLAGTLLQLAQGDILVAEPNDALPNAVVRSRQSGVSICELASDLPQLSLAAALASSQKQAGGGHVVLVLLRAGYQEREWARTLASAEESKLPLILACADPSGAQTFRASAQVAKPAPLTWSSVQRTASRAKLPVLSVDGEDAVAVYRVMQESILRARSGGGPALLWAMLPTDAEAGDRPKAVRPLQRLERYLHTREISF